MSIGKLFFHYYGIVLVYNKDEYSFLLSFVHFYSYRGIFHDFYCCFCFSSVLYTFILFINYKFSDLSLHFDNEMKKKLSRR